MQFFIKIFLILVGNVLYGNIVLDKELINTNTKVSDSAFINTTVISKTDEAIIFVTEDSYIYGSENIFLHTKKPPEENKVKNTLTKLNPKEQNKSISKKNPVVIKTEVPQKNFHNTHEHLFFDNIFSEDINFLQISNHFKFLYLGNIDYQKVLVIKTKKDDKGYFDSKIRLISIVNLSDRAPPV